MSTTSSVPSTLFTGTSAFASTLSQVLTRSESIASLPLQTLQATASDLTDRQTALQGLDSAFSSLQSSIQGLQAAASSGLVSPSVSDDTVSVNAGTGATTGNYTILVSSIGSYSTALSDAGSTPVTDPTSQGISSSTTYTLNINGTDTAITASDDSLDSLASAINAQAGSQVQAEVVNVGSPGSPDYRISLQSATLGANTLDLTDSSGNDLIYSSTSGEPASYSIDGSDPVSSDSRNITIAPGLTATLQNQSSTGEPATISVNDDPSTLIDAFSSLSQAYNNAVTALDQYHGQNGGVLEGDSIISTLTNVLTQLGTFTAGSPETALANYGVTLDQTGQMSVDSSAFTSAANADFSGLVQMLGTSTSGGFLETATNLLTSVEDPTQGVLKQAETSVANQITAQETKISDAQSNLDTVEQNLQQQISDADATIASLENQVSYVGGLFAAYAESSSSSSSSGTSSAQISPQSL